jgi:hypothetical protein
MPPGLSHGAMVVAGLFAPDASAAPAWPAAGALCARRVCGAEPSEAFARYILAGHSFCRHDAKSREAQDHQRSHSDEN